jgi:tetrahydromethanopterin S-methyltransferase subunit G
MDESAQLSGGGVARDGGLLHRAVVAVVVSLLVTAAAFARR